MLSLSLPMTGGFKESANEIFRCGDPFSFILLVNRLILVLKNDELGCRLTRGDFC